MTPPSVFPVLSVRCSICHSYVQCAGAGVATVEWTCVAIYHLSLSTCVGGPPAGNIAIRGKLTVIPSPSKPAGFLSLKTTPELLPNVWICRCSWCISLSAHLNFFLVAWRAYLCNGSLWNTEQRKLFLSTVMARLCWAIQLVLWDGILVHKVYNVCQSQTQRLVNSVQFAWCGLVITLTVELCFHKHINK